MKKLISILLVAVLMMTSVPGVLAAETISGNARASADSKYVKEVVLAENSVLTVTVGNGTTRWASDFYNLDTWSATEAVIGKAEKTFTCELSAGSYYFRVYDPEGGKLDKTPFSITIEATGTGPVAPVKDAYAISEQLHVGEGSTTVNMITTAEVTVVPFEPTETGVYTISVSSGTAAYVGGGAHFIYDWSLVSPATSFEWTCTSVGQTCMVGIVADSDTVTMNVQKKGEYHEVVIQDVIYENKNITPETPVFTLPDNGLIGEYVNVYGEDHTAVLGEDGYYHLDSADGDILLVDMDYLTVLTEVLNSDRPVMYVFITDEEGNQFRYDIAEAVLAYEALCDENGYYPLTEDLMFFYQKYAVDNGVVGFVLEEGYNTQCGWMFACVTMSYKEPVQSDILGDVNCDSEIDVLDAMLVAQYIVGDVDEYTLALDAANVNGDEEINVLDAMMIAQYIVGDVDHFG